MPIPSLRTWRILCFLCWLSILAGMFAPKELVQPFEANQFDKVLHLGALTAMVGLARWALPGIPARLFWALAVLLAFVLEALQPIVQTSREFNQMDVAANLVGVALAALLLWLCRLRKRVV